MRSLYIVFVGIHIKTMVNKDALSLVKDKTLLLEEHTKCKSVLLLYFMLFTATKHEAQLFNYITSSLLYDRVGNTILLRIKYFN